MISWQLYCHRFYFGVKGLVFMVVYVRKRVEFCKARDWWILGFILRGIIVIYIFV